MRQSIIGYGSPGPRFVIESPVEEIDVKKGCPVAVTLLNPQGQFLSNEGNPSARIFLVYFVLLTKELEQVLFFVCNAPLEEIP